MRKFLGYVILLFVIFIPVVSKAANVSVGLECPSAAAAGSTISCSIKMNSDVMVNGVVANYVFSGASYVSFTPQSGFVSNYSSASGFNIGLNSGKTGAYTIGILKVKVNGSATITIKNLDVSDTNYNSYSPINKSVNVRLTSTNNNLGGLTLVGGTLSPAFNANTTKYTSTINASSVTINAIKGDSYQSISGVGKKTLKYGSNTFNVVVKSEAGTSKTYTIVITRPDSRKNDNYLKSLSVDKGTIAFKKDTLTYSLKVGNDVSSIKVNAEVNDNTAKFVSGFGPRTVNLKYGVNNILVKVQAENESTRTYTIKITREDNRSSNTNLSSIRLSDGEINFSKDVTNYKISVPHDVTKINVVATAEDSKSKVSVVAPNLVVGDNIIKITVTAENGQSKIYKIDVKRLEKQVVLSKNNNVISIDINGYGIEFSPDINEYDVNIGDEDSLDIDVMLEDKNANYTIEGNKDLKDGSVIKIIATSESGSVKEYILNVNKEEESSSQSSSSNVNKEVKSSSQSSFPNWLCCLIGFVLGLVTMFVILTIVNNAKKKKKDNIDNIVIPKASIEIEKLDADVKSEEITAIVSPTSTTLENTAHEDDKIEIKPVVEPAINESLVSQSVSQTTNMTSENK